MSGPADEHKKGEGTPPDKAAAPANPFLHSASAFAAAAAAGLDFQRQLANTMLGFFEAALGGAKGEAKAPTEAAPVTEKPAEPVVASVKPTPVVAVAPEPVVEPVKVAKAPVAKAKPKAVVAKEPAAKPAAPKAPSQRVTQVPTPVVEAPAAPARKTRAAKDDLKQLQGVGPKLEQVLNGKGITRLAEIAAWSDEDVKRIDAELGFDGRIGRDDWVGQAKAMTGGRKAKK